MPNKDKTGPRGKGAGTGRGMGGCVTEKQLETTRKGLGPCGNGTPRGGGQGKGMGRRRGNDGITYFT